MLQKLDGILSSSLPEPGDFNIIIRLQDAGAGGPWGVNMGSDLTSCLTGGGYKDLLD